MTQYIPRAKARQIKTCHLETTQLLSEHTFKLTPGRDAIHGREETAVMLDIRKFIETAGLYLDTNE